MVDIFWHNSWLDCVALLGYKYAKLFRHFQKKISLWIIEDKKKLFFMKCEWYHSSFCKKKKNFDKRNQLQTLASLVLKETQCLILGCFKLHTWICKESKRKWNILIKETCSDLVLKYKPWVGIESVKEMSIKKSEENGQRTIMTI